MKVQFFADFIESFGKILTALKDIKNIPKRQRDEIRRPLADTFIMLNTTLNMVIIRLGEVYRLQDEQAFRQEVAQLQYGETWLKSERAFRLCESLKHGLREWQNIDQSLINLLSTNNWNDLKLQMENILKNESELAYFIEENFRRLESLAFDEAKPIDVLKEEIQSLQNMLSKQRRELIELESTMYNLL